MEPFDLDILQSAGFSDFVFSLKSYTPQVYKYSESRSPHQIKCDVLQSARVCHIIQETAQERKQTVEAVRDEAQAILVEMGHNFNLNTIRFMAFTLKKILNVLYRKVLVNKAGLERLKAASYHNPVVLIPSHRSYMDFLLVSFVCFSANLPLPFIAAAQDFMNMRVIRHLFRKSGAFFMRRSFMADKLYWVIFTEYVQNQLQRGQHSLEFFLEGTRSRTSKFLHPRLGLLSMVVDLYANAGVPNILLCPISITYERVLEESLFAYELLGIPKPKESLRGLLRSRSVLQEDYGNIFMHFGELIPLSRCIEGSKLDRMATACIPRHLLLYLTDEEKEVVRQLGYDVTVQLQSHMVVTSSVIVSAIMLQNQHGLPLDTVVQKFAWLQHQFRKLNVALAPIDYSNDKDAVLEAIAFQTRCLEVGADGQVRIMDPESTHEERQASSAVAHAYHQQHQVISSVKDVLDEAAIYLQLAYKRNTLLPYFFGIGMVALSLNKHRKRNNAHLSDEFDFLSRMMVREVAGLADSLNQIFDQAIDTLLANDIISRDHEGLVTVKQDAFIEFAAGLWQPLLTAYWLMSEHLLKNVGARDSGATNVDITKGGQHLAAEYVLSGHVKYFEVLSLELLNNGLKMFIEMGIVQKDKSSGGPAIVKVVERSRIQDIHDKIGSFLDISNNPSYMATVTSKL